MELSARSLSDIDVSQQGYIDLIKSSWILIDVIARHPQLNLLDSGIRCDIELLANVRFHLLLPISVFSHVRPSLLSVIAN